MLVFCLFCTTQAKLLINIGFEFPSVKNANENVKLLIAPDLKGVYLCLFHITLKNVYNIFMAVWASEWVW